MKHVTFSDKSLLVDDETADTLVRYAAALASNGTADSVDLQAYGSDGDHVVATMLLSEGASLMAESTHSHLPGPDNAEALAYMQDKLRRLQTPRAGFLDESTHVLTGVAEYDY